MSDENESIDLPHILHMQENGINQGDLTPEQLEQDKVVDAAIDTYEADPTEANEKAMIAASDKLKALLIASAEEEAPATEEKPVEEKAPAAEEKPVEEEAPATEEKPVEEKPVEEEAPATEEKPVEEEAPAAEEKPVEEKRETNDWGVGGVTDGSW